MLGFERRRNYLNDDYSSLLMSLQGEIDQKWQDRLQRIRTNWNFYEGYHWEDMSAQDTPELSVNYCRAFVNKFVSFELGKGFSFSTHSNAHNKPITADGMTLFDFLEYVWDDNEQGKWCIDMGITKSVTGEAWVRVAFEESTQDTDPFNEYEHGRITIPIMPTNVVFPEFDPHDSKRLVRLTIMYVYKKRVQEGVLGRYREEDTVFRQVWTNETITTRDGKEEPVTVKNKYGVIPFVQIKNLSLVGKDEGVSDLEDIIPLNTEYNMKQSNVSEIIDYHSSPVTVVYGARISNIEKGANKLWGGLPKDAKVENLEMKGDSGLSKNYIDSLKLSMCEVGNIPETVLGGASAISNTSGVALQYINLPLIERTRMKRQETISGIVRLNKMIILVALCEGLITKPADVSNRDFYNTECELPDTLPKDTLIELQQIQMEMTMGIEDRQGAMKRMGKENIDELLNRIDEDRAKHPEIYGSIGKKGTSENGNPSLNSGLTNSETPAEHVRIALNGKNGND